MITKDSRALMKSPYKNTLLLMVKCSVAKLGFPPIALISGVTISLIRAWTTALNAMPMTTATARSTRLPRSKNFLKPPIGHLPCIRHGGVALRASTTEAHPSGLLPLWPHDLVRWPQVGGHAGEEPHG